MEFVNFFKTLYKQSPQQKNEEEMGLYFQNTNATEMRSISETDQQLLYRPPTEQEVKETLFQMGPDKAPGPDRITRVVI